jgi:hypothetical protein
VANAGGFQAFVDFLGQTGNMKLKLNAKGGFSGSVTVPGGKPARFKGVFDSTGVAQVLIGGQPAVFTFDRNTGLITLTLDGQTVEMRHGVKTAGALVGRYHLALPGMSDGTCPEGTGYAVVKVAVNGSARITGRLGDAAVFSVGAVLSTDGTLPVFANLAKGSEVAAGYLTFSATSSGIDGELAWVRSANPLAVLYPEGFDATINATGGRYVAPAIGQTVLADARLTLGSGNLGAEIVSDIAAGVAAGNPTTTVRVNAVTGVVTGRFMHPADGRKRSFGGLVQPLQNGAYGLFVGVNETGYVSMVGE